MENFFKKYWVYILIFFATLSISWPLLNESLFWNHDNLHSIRMLAITDCFADGQIPCRWTKDLGWGNGYPLFNYYGPGPYYLGGILSYLTGYIGAEKILVFLSISLAGLGMFLLVRNLWGVLPAALSSILYIYAPYRALDIYVRGALTEAFAIALLPFLFFFIKKAIEEGKLKDFIFLTLTGFSFLITHNIMTILFAPLIAIWVVVILWKNKWKEVNKLILFGAIAFGLSAFFLLPAFFEKGLVRLDQLTTGYFDYRNHFLSVWRLFIDRSWGYLGDNYSVLSSMSFQLGLPYWPLSIIAGIYLIYGAIKKKIDIIPSLFFLFYLFSVIMMHNKSIFIWENLPLLKYFQFPWRMLALSAFSSSLLGGYLISLIKDKKLKVGALVVFTALTILLNWNYFKPKEYLTEITENNIFNGENWERQRRGLTFDYLPKGAIEPREAAPTMPLIRSGSAEINDFVNYSNHWQFSVKVTEEALLEIPVYYFPGWKLNVNGQTHPFTYQGNIGRIVLTLPKGDYLVEGLFANTNLRAVSNLITVISLFGLIGISYYAKNKKLFK